MSSLEAPIKVEKDYSAVVDVALPEADALAKKGQLQQAIESLLTVEKQSRNSGDMISNARLLVKIIQLCYEEKNWKFLSDNVLLLSKKHGFLKGAVQKMVQEAMTFIDKTPDQKIKLELIDTLRTVTEGKIFVEVERARVTRILSKIKEDEKKITEAADILQELQVETFGSMDKREKTDFILEQMRLCLAKLDYQRVLIISKKISGKFFEDVANQDLKLRFCNLMIEHAIHEEKFLQVCKYYRQIYDTSSILEVEAKWNDALKNVVFFVALAPYDNEQSDLINRIYEDARLSKLPLIKQFLKCFITNELMRWPKIDEIYGATLKSTSVFNMASEGGNKRWKELHKRVIEHNIRVVAKYYNRITIGRLTQLLDLPAAETESFLSNLVVNKTIYAKIDRPAGIINFKASQNPHDILNEWSGKITNVLELIGQSTHLIAKEEMVQEIVKVM